jgi:hypothetical protein
MRRHTSRHPRRPTTTIIVSWVVLLHAAQLMLSPAGVV